MFVGEEALFVGRRLAWKAKYCIVSSVLGRPLAEDIAGRKKAA